MTSFSEDMRRRGMVPGSRTLSMERELAGARLGRLLHVSPSEEILVIKRLRLADGETMAIETLHLPARARARASRPKDLERLVLRALPRPLRDHDRERHAGDRADGDRTRRSRRRSACRSIRRRSSSSGRAATSDGRTVEFVQSVYRGDRYRIVTELSRPPGPTRPLTTTGPVCDIRAVANWYRPIGAPTGTHAPATRTSREVARRRLEGDLDERREFSRRPLPPSRSGSSPRRRARAGSGRRRTSSPSGSRWMRSPAGRTSSRPRTTQFQNDHPGWTVDVQYQNWGDHLQKFDATSPAATRRT